MLRPSGRRIRLCLGGLWLVDAALQVRPQFFGYDWWHNDLAESVMGQPEPISRSILWATGHLAPHAALANSLAVTVQLLLGLCLLLGRFERAAIVASIPWSLGVWWVGEGLGALPTGFGELAGGAPGPVLLYPLIGLACWPRFDCQDGLHRRRTCAGTLAAWLAIWVGGALAGLPWRFPAATMIRANIEANGLNQPRGLSAISHASYRAVGSHPVLVPSALLLVQLVIGVAVLSRRARPYALSAGMALAVLFWITVQGLGGLAAGTGTDPGSAPLLVLLAVSVASATPERGHNSASVVRVGYLPRAAWRSRTCSWVCSRRGRMASATSARPRSIASEKRLRYRSS